MSKLSKDKREKISFVSLLIMLGVLIAWIIMMQADNNPHTMAFATGANPTPTITPIPPYGYGDCITDCIYSYYPDRGVVDPCLSTAYQGGTVTACLWGCSGTGLAYALCAGNCYAISVSTCMGFELVTFTAIAAGCAVGCL
ncbi:MAG: hypothetical protein AB1656_05805 [Candidatus Omnitrophota bacterium]